MGVRLTIENKSKQLIYYGTKLLLSELNRLINLPIEEKYKIIGDNLAVILGEGICND